MPKYRVELSDGRKFEVEASGPPSEADVMAALGANAATPSDAQPDERPGLEPRSTAPLAAVAAAGAIPAVLALGKRAAEHVATSPTTAKIASQVSKLGRRASPAVVLYQAATGDLKGAAKSAAVGAAATYGPRLAQNAAARAATALPASPAAIGAGAGLALPLAFLGALQADANRKPAIDPEANTPASVILRGFQTMAGKR